MEMARAHQETLAKPPHSLGMLEDIAVQIAGLTGKVFNRADRRRVIVFASDNGVVEEGVASAPQSVTLAQTINISRGLTGVGVIAKHYHTELDVIDLGVNADFEYPGVLNEKIAFGTKNFAREPAMTLLRTGLPVSTTSSGLSARAKTSRAAGTDMQTRSA